MEDEDKVLTKNNLIVYDEEIKKYIDDNGSKEIISSDEPDVKVVGDFWLQPY